MSNKPSAGDTASTESWALVYRQLSRAREALAEAQHGEQYQAIGILCRETLISLAQAVYIPGKHRTLDGIAASKTDAKRMLDAYIATELPGETNQYARAAARAAVNLALDLQHTRTADYALGAMTVEQTASVVSLVSITARKAQSRSTVAELCNRWLEENPETGLSSAYMVRRMAASKIGELPAADLQKEHVLAFAQWLKQDVKKGKPARPPTVYKYVSYLRLIIARARDEWRLSVSPHPVNEAMRELFSGGEIERSTPRTHDISFEDIEKIRKFLVERETIPGIYGIRATIPVSELSEFSLWSGRRLGEITKLRWNDVDMDKRTCIVRGLKAASTKETWDHKFPLFGRAWEIIQARDKAGRVSERIFPYRHQSLGHSYRSATEALELRHIRFQDLRRLTVRVLKNADHTVPEILAVLGRVDTREIMRELGITQKPHRPPSSRRLRGMLAMS